jgi:hypothetical protein
MSGIKNSPTHDYYYYLNYLFFSIFMIDGKNILKHRENLQYEIIKVFKESPSSFSHAILNRLNLLTERMNTASKLIEAYGYENSSRYSWTIKKKLPLNDSMNTGILGTEVLGLNQFQKH